MRRNISIRRDSNTINFGDGTFVLGALDMGTHSIDYNTIDREKGVEYLSAKIREREITITGYVVCKRAINPDGSVVPSTARMTAAKEKLEDICSLTDPFILSVENAWVNCHMKESVKWESDYEYNNDQLSKFTITCVSSWSDYSSPIFWDPSENAWCYNVYGNLGVVLEKKIFATPLTYSWTSKTGQSYSGIIGIEVNHFESTNRTFSMRVKNITDYKFPSAWSGQTLYTEPDTYLDFVKFDTFTPTLEIPVHYLESVKATWRPDPTVHHRPYSSATYNVEDLRLGTHGTPTSISLPRVYMDPPADGSVNRYAFILWPKGYFYQGGSVKTEYTEAFFAFVTNPTDIELNFIV